MKLLQRLFGAKKPACIKADVSGTFAKISHVLSERQKDEAFLFYMNHKDKIDERISNTELAYEPSEREDKNDPRIWKDEYWKWFLANYR
jgi:hypothetical protein